jgi:hypothetical protein
MNECCKCKHRICEDGDPVYCGYHGETVCYINRQCGQCDTKCNEFEPGGRQ